MPGRSSGSYGIFEDGNGMARAIAAMNALPGRVKRIGQQEATAQVGKLVSVARENFHSSIQRFNRQTDGSRKTSETFTFGSGGAFQGRLIKLPRAQGFGFGFPDVGHADAATDYVWRSLEHGLQGTKTSNLKGISSPTSLGLFALFPQGTHVLPRKYIWDDNVGRGGAPTGTAALILAPKTKARDTRQGSGIDGKHFIEEAWIQQLPFIERKFRTVVTEEIEKAFKAK